MKTSSNLFSKGNIKWLKRFQVLLDPFVETSILFGILKYKHFKPINLWTTVTSNGVTL